MTSDINLRYPDEVAFAFNPVLFSVVSAAKKLQSLSVAITCDSKTVEYSMGAYDGYSVTMDVRDFVQSFFDGVQININVESFLVASGLSINMTFNVSYTDETEHKNAFSGSFLCIWGVMRHSDVFAATRSPTWFYGYPFTFDIYNHVANNNVMLGINETGSSYGLENVGLYRFSANAIIENIGDDVTQLSAQSINGGTPYIEYDETYNRFGVYGSGNKNRVLVNVNIDTSTHYDEHVYLRWIDRFGCYNYYLFKAGGDSVAVTTDGEARRNNLLLYGSGTMSDARQYHSRTDSKTICAPLVDAGTFDFLLDMLTSPVVDMLIEYEQGDLDRWRTVNVAAGNHTRTTDELQDFVATITIPTITLQSF